MKRSTSTLAAAAIAIPVLAFALIPAVAQPAGTPPTPTNPAPPGPRGEGPNRGPRGDGEGSPWREKFRTELREHPRLGRALVALHEAKEYLEKSPSDFGGTKVATLKSIDESIKQVTETIKHDEKRSGPKGDGPEGKGKGKGKGNDDKKD